MESHVRKNEKNNLTNLGDRMKMVEERMKNMEKFNYSMSNLMITILKSLSDNIFNISGKLKSRGFFMEKDGKDNDEDRMEEDMLTQSHIGWCYEKNQ